MAILGIGLDIVELERIGRLYERHGARFVARFCASGEAQPRHGTALIEHLGGLFAAKEAVLKALGTGWAQGLGFRQVEVVRNSSGAPAIRLHGAASQRAERLGVLHSHLTITHERAYAAAFAVLEGEAKEIGITDHAA
jgi:holo-[acyl-carrier protein] synthase